MNFSDQIARYTLMRLLERDEALRYAPVLSARRWRADRGVVAVSVRYRGKARKWLEAK